MGALKEFAKGLVKGGGNGFVGAVDAIVGGVKEIGDGLAEGKAEVKADNLVKLGDDVKQFAAGLVTKTKRGIATAVKKEAVEEADAIVKRAANAKAKVEAELAAERKALNAKATDLRAREQAAAVANVTLTKEVKKLQRAVNAQPKTFVDKVKNLFA